MYQNNTPNIASSANMVHAYFDDFIAYIANNKYNTPCIGRIPFHHVLPPASGAACRKSLIYNSINPNAGSNAKTPKYCSCTGDAFFANHAISSRTPIHPNKKIYVRVVAFIIYYNRYIFMFYVLCFMFYVLCFMFYVVCCVFC